MLFRTCCAIPSAGGLVPVLIGSGPDGSGVTGRALGGEEERKGMEIRIRTQSSNFAMFLFFSCFFS